MKKFLKGALSLMLALACTLSMVACGSNGGNQTSAAASSTSGDTITITDHNGNQVEVPKKIDRIVICDIYPLPSVMTVFFDSAEKLVGIHEASMSAAKSGLLGELYPEILKAETGFMKGSTLNVEELTKLNPDVVFYNSSSKEVGEQLKNAGIPGIAVSASKWDYDSITTLTEWIKLLDQLFPENGKADKVDKYSKEKYQFVQDRVKDIKDADKRKAFFIMNYNDTTFTSSGAHFFGQWWCDAIGAKNVAEEIDKDNNVPVTIEQVYKWNPELIFITNFNQVLPDDLYGNKVASHDWSSVEAVAKKNVAKLPLGIYRTYTPGVDTPITLLWMAKQAYPDKFKDVDITKETKEYYKAVFGIEITDTQVEKMFNSKAEAGKGF